MRCAMRCARRATQTAPGESDDRLAEILVDRREELLGRLPRLLGADEDCEIFCHLAALDRLDAHSLERLGELRHRRRIVHSSARQQPAGPGEDRGDRIR